jgi:hypothetical protein
MSGLRAQASSDITINDNLLTFIVSIKTSTSTSSSSISSLHQCPFEPLPVQTYSIALDPSHYLKMEAMSAGFMWSEREPTVRDLIHKCKNGN